MGRNRSERTEAIAEILEADIVEGRLLPGERLDEHRLAERFGVSRTPVRETLRRLVAKGLVEEQAAQGCAVARTSLHELLEMFEMVNELETSAAGLAAQRIDQNEANRLREAVAECKRVAEFEDGVAYSRANLAFHEVVYTASGNRFLVDAIRQVSARAARFRCLALRLPGWSATSAFEHAEIAEAIIARDTPRARRLMARHMNIFARSEFPRFVALLSRQMTGS
jgi:DNA-binding GntR family transcriptional regulator